MSWIDGARARLHLLFAKHAAESRMDEEIAFHVEMESQRLMREGGLSPDEARRRALVTFGGVTQHKEELRAGRGVAWLGGLSLDFRLALRMLVKYPGLTLVAVVGMAVAVAIAAVTFSAIYTILNGGLPVSEGDRVVAIRNLDRRIGNEGRQTHLHDLATWRQSMTTVSELGAYRIVDRNVISGTGPSESARVAEMTASGFRIARTPPLVGRYLHDDDERPGAEPVVVIGYDLWQSRFGGRLDIVGHIIQLGDTKHRVIGVMPRGFAFPVNNRLWTPLRLNPAAYEPGHAPSIDVFGRLADGASIEDARRQAVTIAQRLAAAEPATHATMRTRVVPYTHAFIDNAEATWTYHLIQALITMLLVVIGTNVAILVYARTASRMGEIAIRNALGASRRRVVTQLFAEALALSLIAAAVGNIIAHFALLNIDAALMRIGGEQLPYWLRVHLTPGAMLYSVGLAVLAAVIVGVVPALKATGRHVRASLQHLSAGTSGMRLGRSWTVLVIAQVTIAVAVLPLAIAGISNWRKQQSAEEKLAAKKVLTATLFLDPDTASARYVALRGELMRRLEGEPGVTDVALASAAPASEPAERTEAEDKSTSVVYGVRIDRRYFDVLDIPVLAGRAFEAGDVTGKTTSVVIVNRSFARNLFAGANPVGRRIRVAPMNARPANDTLAPAPWEEIVGMVPDFPVDSTTPEPRVYRPMLPSDAEPATLVVRLKGVNAAPFTQTLRELTVATDPMLRIDRIKTLEQNLEDESSATRLFIIVVELVTLSTLLLSAAGIYALMAFTITRRRREIGIRAALGAGPRRLLVGVLSRVMAQIAVGILIGTAIAAFLDDRINGGWTGRRPQVVLPGVIALMIGVGLITAIGPARRALGIQPTEALRAE